MKAIIIIPLLLVLGQTAPIQAGRYFNRGYDGYYDRDDYHRYPYDDYRRERYHHRYYSRDYRGYGYGYCCEESYGWGRTRPEQGTKFSDKDFQWESRR